MAMRYAKNLWWSLCAESKAVVSTFTWVRLKLRILLGHCEIKFAVPKFSWKKNAKLYVCLLDQEGAHTSSSFHIGNTGLIVPLSLPPCFIIELVFISISAEARQTRQITRQLEFQRATTEVIYRPENRDFIFVNSRILNPARMRILPWVPVYLGF